MITLYFTVKPMVNQMNEQPSLAALRKQLKQQRHRALVILSGSLEWQKIQLKDLWHSDESILYIGETEKNITTQAQYHLLQNSRMTEQLGQETDSVVIDVRAGLNANTLGIASGMIRAGGLLVLLTPDLETWKTLENPDNKRFLNSPYQINEALPYFTQHLIKQWQVNSETPAVWLHEDETHSNTLTNIFPPPSSNLSQPTAQTLPTQAQSKAILAIDSVAFGHRKRPLVITADRGRGKSSTLGLAAIHCLVEGKTHVVLTASRLDQAKMAFIQATQALSALGETHEISVSVQQTGRLCFSFNDQEKVFEFVAPDQLIQEATQADLLLVDEAAHLPTPLLTELLMHHHRMVFATTLHGYEGSGRGFELRFKKVLNQHTPDWKNIHLKEPIRWADHDPLEAAINHALFLDAANPSPEQKTEQLPLSTLIDQSIELQEINIQSLLANTSLFHSLFRLLVQAHYQTSPNDLQLLLSAPNLKIMVATQEAQLIGVVLCVAEGKIMPKMKRVHGHLVPQLLVKHYALSDFFMLSSWRIMRIAVHPHIQREGIGKQLLNYLKHTAQQQKIDYLSSSFGASEELLPFWFQQGYTPVHVGVKRDKSSGSHNMVVTKALTPMAQQAIASIQRAFQAQFPHVLMESLPHFPAAMILAVLKSFRFKTHPPYIEEAVNQFRQGLRAYESVSGQLWEWSIRSPCILLLEPEHLQGIWCDKVLKKQSWAEVANKYQLAGRKGVEEALIELLINAPLSIKKTPYQKIDRIPDYGRFQFI